MYGAGDHKGRPYESRCPSSRRVRRGRPRGSPIRLSRCPGSRRAGAGDHEGRPYDSPVVRAAGVPGAGDHEGRPYDALANAIDEPVGDALVASRMLLRT